MPSESARKGKAQEYYVMYLLLKRGYQVYVPAADLDGIDILVRDDEGGFVELQVKSLKMSKDNYRIQVKNLERIWNRLIVCVDSLNEDIYVIPSTVYCKIAKVNPRGEKCLYIKEIKNPNIGMKNEKGLKLIDRALKDSWNKIDTKINKQLQMNNKKK